MLKEYPKEGMGFIYCLSHPITKEIRYIGQTERSLNKRLIAHITSAKCDKRLSIPVWHWILKLLSDGLRPEIQLIEMVPLYEMDSKEIEHIKEGRLKYNLLNISGGGKVEGRKKGWKPSKETIEKLKKSSRKGSNTSLFFNYIGTQLGELTIIGFCGFIDGKSVWTCLCSCGNSKIINIEQVQTITSCGCARKNRWDNKAKIAWREKVESKIKRSNENGRYEKMSS